MLVVDDEEEVLETFQAFLQRRGYRCPIAPDAVSALRFVKKGSIDLVLTDYHMPEVNGLELLQEIRQVEPKLPVVLMSGAADMRQALGALREQAFDFLPKPIDSRELLEVIELALRKHSPPSAPEAGKGVGPVYATRAPGNPSVTILHFNRPLDEYSVKAFESALRQLTAGGELESRIVIALRHVSYINSVGLNFLLETLEAWKGSGFRFALVEISDPVYRYLKLLGYLDYVPNATNISKGVALVTVGGSSEPIRA